MAGQERGPLVGVVMGSDSDLPTMQWAVAALDRFNISSEVGIASAHRTAEDMMDYARSAVVRGLHVIIAGAGGSAHLPGMLASETIRPVCGVAIESSPDPMQAAVGSQVRMPQHKPLAYMGKEKAGAWNAGIFAAKILAVHDSELAKALEAYDELVAAESRSKNTVLRDVGIKAYLLDNLKLDPKAIAPDLK